MNSHIRKLLLAVLATVALLSVGQLATPVSAQGNWAAEYFPNQTLSGAPAITRSESALNFDWGGGSPGAGVPSDGFSARFTRDEWFEAGTYRFNYRSDDGIRVWVGDQLVVDDWRDRQGTWASVDRVIPRGTQRVRVEYFEHTGGALIQLGWERVSGGNTWRGEYFNNRDLSGSPALVRYDAAIDFDWGTGSPGSGVSADNFSVRWSRTLGFNAGTYRFHSSTDDGVRVTVNGVRVIDSWFDQRLATRTGDITLPAGQHTIVVEYYEHGDKAAAHVWWDLRQAFSGWEGRYYDNPDLRGGPALIRDDAAISFDWGQGAPANWMPSDNFSAVWTRQVTFSPGKYRINVQADDGVRVWLDDHILMDYWQPQDNVWRYVDGIDLQGAHTLRVEYFERSGNARIRFWWELSSTPPAPAPSVTPAAPAPTAAPGMPGPWQAAYYNNRALTGTPALERVDSAIDFSWGLASPASGVVNRDSFSVRWTGSFPFAAGRYTFSTYSDDGIRVYVDGQLVINSWRAMRGSRSGSVSLSEGNHTVEVEYFEAAGAANARVSWRQISAAYVPPAATPMPTPARPVTPAGGPLTLDAWAVSTWCDSGGWTARMFVEGHGGASWYTYAWEGITRAGPTAGSATFDLHSASRGTAMVGRVSVTSGGQTVSRALFVAAPKCQ